MGGYKRQYVYTIVEYREHGTDHGTNKQREMLHRVRTRRLEPPQPIELLARDLPALHRGLAVLGEVLPRRNVVVDAVRLLERARAQYAVREDEGEDDRARGVTGDRAGTGQRGGAETDGLEEGGPDIWDGQYMCYMYRMCYQGSYMSLTIEDV
jgi:hypothetical protein